MGYSLTCPIVNFIRRFLKTRYINSEWLPVGKVDAWCCRMDVFGLVVRHLILRLHGILRGSGDKMICLMFQLLNCYPSISEKYQKIVKDRSKWQNRELNKYRLEIFPDDLADLDMIWHWYCLFLENIIDVRMWISVNH